MATLYAYSPNGTQATLPVNVMGFTQSLATNGWCKLPNGLIFQWLADTNNGLSIRWTFPVAFPTRVCIFTALAYGEDVNDLIIRGMGTNGGQSSSLSTTGIGKIEIYIGFVLGY